MGGGVPQSTCMCALFAYVCRCACFFFFQAEDGIRDLIVTGVQTCALPISVTHGREIGVDLEAIRPAIAQERIPESFFSPREVAALRALPVDAQAEAFFAC